MLNAKKILVGVTGSIAAYKTALLVRLLVKEGAEVRVIMTPSARDFITPLTLSTLSKNPVYSEFYDPKNGSWHNHVELGLWADAFVIAPASANTLARMVQGQCDNLLLATYLSARCPVFFAPAMDLDMYAHPSTRINLETLQAYGNIMIDAEDGELASGLEGKGRMAEPEHILEILSSYFEFSERFKGRKVLVTAGPTYEAIDPVRFIGNHSSGKMGFAIAEAFAAQGAEVELISGPVSLKTKHPSIHTAHVSSASEMLEAVKNTYSDADIAVMSAAVSDYTPETTEEHKIKKSEDTLQLSLRKTTDILAEMGKEKKKGQVLVGFALETRNELDYAKDKMMKKNLDLVVMNSLRDEGAGFGTDTNKVTLIDRNNKIEELALKSKQEVARDIVNKVFSLMYA